MSMTAMTSTRDQHMPTIPFKQVDVFTSVPFKGNPVAVVLQADELSTTQMQQIANWTNLSETTFVLAATSAEADYRVRIFTPLAELPFAGHPTIGTAHALLEAGRIEARDGALVQECGAGLVKLQVENGAHGERWISFDLPQAQMKLLGDDEVDELEAILGCAVPRDALRPRLIDVGARWVVAQLPDARAVLSSRPDLVRMKAQNTKDQATGVVIFGEHEPGAPARIEVRAFAPACGIGEDPVCGSGNGCVGAFIRANQADARFSAEFIAAQGSVLGRAGQVRIAIDSERIQVGGMCVTCIDGQLTA
jgi:PhzF family phenazine biosynthesis protein